MNVVEEIKSQLMDAGINPNSVLALCIEKVIADLKEETIKVKRENIALQIISRENEKRIAMMLNKFPEDTNKSTRDIFRE
jgi:hypothetical protein